MLNPKDYGDALFLLSEERGRSDAVRSQIELTRTLLAQHPDYVRLLDTPAVAAAEKATLIDGAFASLDADLVNFIKILSDNHALYLFDRCAAAFEEAFNEARGIEKVEAVTAVAMRDDQKRRLCDKLAAMTGKTILLSNKVDPSVLGGLCLRYCGRQVDATLATRLSAFEKAVKQTVL